VLLTIVTGNSFGNLSKFEVVVMRLEKSVMKKVDRWTV
jgi:hypothetical protein